VVAALVLMARPEWLGRYGIALSLVSIAAMSSSFLTMQAGSALRGELHLHGEAASLISEHSQAANILAIVFTLFTAILILTFAAYRISGGMRRLLHLPAGDLGAKAVWSHVPGADSSHGHFS
jgi:hypothetical protein